VAAVALAQLDLEVLGGEPRHDLAHPGDLLVRLARFGGDRVPRGDAVRGDRDVQEYVRDRELVDEVAQGAQLAHQRRLERSDRVGGDAVPRQRAAERLGVERRGIHLVVREP
jgi:hypothetical protein